MLRRPGSVSSVPGSITTCAGQWKGADEVLPARQVDGRLAADCGVDLADQRCRYWLPQGDTAHVARRREPQRRRSYSRRRAPTIVPSRPIRSERQRRSSTAIAFAGSPGEEPRAEPSSRPAEGELRRDPVDPGDVAVGDDLNRTDPGGTQPPRGDRLPRQSTALPQHMGAFIPALARIITEYPLHTMRAGDVYTMNDPHDGGTHLPDLIVAAPAVVDGRIVAFSVCLAHQEDFGGKVAGSMPTDSTEIYQEGLIVPPLKLYDAGRPDATLFKMIERNVRLPRQVLGDIDAQVSAVTVGCQRIVDLCRSEGSDHVLAYMDHLLDYAEQRTRACIAAIPDGVYQFTDYMDNDGITLDCRVPNLGRHHDQGQQRHRRLRWNECSGSRSD